MVSGIPESVVISNAEKRYAPVKRSQQGTSQVVKKERAESINGLLKLRPVKSMVQNRLQSTPLTLNCLLSTYVQIPKLDVAGSIPVSRSNQP